MSVLSGKPLFWFVWFFDSDFVMSFENPQYKQSNLEDETGLNCIFS